jgi:hypothetical protein
MTADEYEKKLALITAFAAGETLEHFVAIDNKWYEIESAIFSRDLMFYRIKTSDGKYIYFTDKIIP